MTTFIVARLNLGNDKRKKIIEGAHKKHEVAINVTPQENDKGDFLIFLTQSQFQKLRKDKSENKTSYLKLSVPQLKKSKSGGLLPLLAAIPALTSKPKAGPKKRGPIPPPIPNVNEIIPPLLQPVPPAKPKAGRPKGAPKGGPRPLFNREPQGGLVQEGLQALEFFGKMLYDNIKTAIDQKDKSERTAKMIKHYNLVLNNPELAAPTKSGLLNIIRQLYNKNLTAKDKQEFLSKYQKFLDDDKNYGQQYRGGPNKLT